MKKIYAIIITISIMTGCSTYEQKDYVIKEEPHLYNFYPDAILEKSYYDLILNLNDEKFIKDNELENFIIRIDEYSHSIMTGFVIGEEFELNLSDYSTLNHQTDTTYEDVYIIRFEKNNYPYTTYYEGLFTDQLVPTVFHFYYDSITQDEIIIYFFLNNTSEWELMDVIHHSPS